MPWADMYYAGGAHLAGVRQPGAASIPEGSDCHAYRQKRFCSSGFGSEAWPKMYEVLSSGCWSHGTLLLGSLTLASESLLQVILQIHKGIERYI